MQLELPPQAVPYFWCFPLYYYSIAARVSPLWVFTCLRWSLKEQHLAFFIRVCQINWSLDSIEVSGGPEPVKTGGVRKAIVKNPGF